MSLERRLTEALRATEQYQPSADLFARLHRSIEEDRDHRRRVRISVGAALAGALTVVLFLAAVVRPGSDGGQVIPKWSLQLLVAATLAAVLVTLGPALRRLGGPLLHDVFHLSPETGLRFSRLLDIAYYLFFGGIIVSTFDPRGLTDPVGVAGEDVGVALTTVAGFLLQLGIAHVATLVALPLVGLVFTASARRVRRQSAGADAPPVSARARSADRVATAVVMAAAALAVVGVLTLVGVILVTLGTG